jgi:hypothetical protein
MISTTVIQAMLAPAVMISACGLLLLGMNSKYSLVIDRIRNLLLEKRSHAGNIGDSEYAARLAVINQQLEEFRVRVQMVRNAVVGYLVAVTCFILTSFAIGVQQWVTLPSLSLVAVICFMIGMFSVLVGASFAVLDAWTGYKVIMIEMNDDRAGHA